MVARFRATTDGKVSLAPAGPGVFFAVFLATFLAAFLTAFFLATGFPPSKGSRRPRWLSIKLRIESMCSGMGAQTNRQVSFLRCDSFASPPRSDPAHSCVPSGRPEQDIHLTEFFNLDEAGALLSILKHIHNRFPINCNGGRQDSCQARSMKTVGLAKRGGPGAAVVGLHTS